jgi:hypothetical protein
MKRILAIICRYSLLLCLLAPLTSLAQQSIETKKDSLKQAFLREDAIRTRARAVDTMKIKFIKSPLLVISTSSKPLISANQQLSVQGIRFRHSHYLNFLLRANMVKPITISEPTGKLYLTLDDQSTIILNFEGRVTSRGNGMKNSSNLKFEYKLPDEDFKLLLNKKVIAIKMDGDGLSYAFNISSSDQSVIQKACLSIQ